MSAAEEAVILLAKSLLDTRAADKNHVRRSLRDARNRLYGPLSSLHTWRKTETDPPTIEQLAAMDLPPREAVQLGLFE